MTNLLSIGSAPTMTSLQLVERINEFRQEQFAAGATTKMVTLLHKNFMQKVPDVLGNGYAIFLADHRNEQNGQTYQIGIFPKREACLLAMSYSYELQARVFDMMTELERVSSQIRPFAVPTTFASALRLAAEQAEQIEAQALQIAADKPKVEFAEAIRAVDGVCSIEKIAKTIGWGRNKFFDRLREDSVLMANNLPYQKYIDRGYFTVAEQMPYTDSKGETHPTFATRVTGAGQVFLAKRYAQKMGGDE